MFLLCTGARLGEAVSLKWTDVSLAESRALIRQTKTEGARTVFLPPHLVKALAALEAAEKERVEKAKAKAVRDGVKFLAPVDTVFGLTKCSRIYTYLETATKAAEAVIPDRVAFHLFRHTRATWLRRYAGMDTAGLVESGAWRSRQSAAVYEHLEASKEAKKAAMLPAMES
jgi:integrase